MGIGPYNRPHKTPNLKGGQGRPPLQMVLEKPRGSCEKTPHFLFCVVGVDAHLGAFVTQEPLLLQSHYKPPRALDLSGLLHYDTDR